MLFYHFTRRRSSILQPRRFQIFRKLAERGAAVRIAEYAFETAGYERIEIHAVFRRAHVRLDSVARLAQRVRDAQLHARALVGHSAVEHHEQHVRIPYRRGVDVEYDPRPLFFGFVLHQRRLVSVALGTKDGIARVFEHCGDRRVIILFAFAEHRSREIYFFHDPLLTVFLHVYITISPRKNQTYKVLCCSCIYITEV